VLTEGADAAGRDWVPVAMFYPQGMATDATVLVQCGGIEQAKLVQLRGLTGSVSITEPPREPEETQVEPWTEPDQPIGPEPVSEAVSETISNPVGQPSLPTIETSVPAPELDRDEANTAE